MSSSRRPARKPKPLADWEEQLLSSATDPIPADEPKRSKGVVVTTDSEDSSVASKIIPNHPLHGVFPPKTKIGKALTVWTAGTYVYNTGVSLRGRYDRYLESKNKYVLRISSSDEESLYHVVYGWILDSLNVDDVTEYDLVTYYKKNFNKVFRTPGTKGSYDIDIAGHPVRLELDETETQNMGSGVTAWKKNMAIRCETEEALTDVTDFLIDLWYDYNGETDRPETEAGLRPQSYLAWAGNRWTYKSYIPRKPESVILAEGMRENLFADIERFRSLRSEYLRLNIPWHRGYLFHGPPGTGKTSLALSVASDFDIPVYFMSLSRVPDDAALVNAISNIDDEEAVLIMEDIDVAQATHSRVSDNSENDGVSKVTLGGLLNVLDGIDTPSGLITIMTTNHKGTLDPALIRPGRVDLDMHITVLDDSQLARMVQWYIGSEVKDLPSIKCDIVPADITGLMKNRIGNAEGFLSDLTEYITQENQKAAARNAEITP